MHRSSLRIACAAALVCIGFARADVTAFPVLPSKTDFEIHTFDTPHWVYVDRDILVDHKQGLAQDRHELLLWLTGTGGSGRTAEGFVNLAAELGYHVISLAYPDEIPASTCDGDPDPNAFERFRMAIIQGGNAKMQGGRALFNVDPPESIENRLLKLLVRLQNLRPREQWGQFLDSNGGIKWDSIAVAGQSQGGGHAALIGIKVRVERVLCFGSPKDYSRRLNMPAAWYSEPSATPKDRFFAFNHVQDVKGCTPQELYLNLQTLLGPAFGTPARVDSEPYPYHHARVLYTAYPVVTITSVDGEGAKLAHGSAISTANAERWKQEWTYMLTEGSP